MYGNLRRGHSSIVNLYQISHIFCRQCCNLYVNLHIMVRLRFKVGKNLHRNFDGRAAIGRSAMCTCIHTDAPCKCGERGRAGTWKEAVQRLGALPRMSEASHTFHATVHVRLCCCVHVPYTPQLHPPHPGPQPRAHA